MAAFPLYAPILPFLYGLDIVSMMTTNKTMRDWVVKRKEHEKYWSQKMAKFDVGSRSIPRILQYEAARCANCFDAFYDGTNLEYYKTAVYFNAKYPLVIPANRIPFVRFLCTLCRSWTCWNCESSIRVRRCCLICNKCNQANPNRCVSCLKEHCPLHPKLISEYASDCVACRKSRKRKTTMIPDTSNTSNTAIPSKTIMKAYRSRKLIKRRKT